MSVVCLPRTLDDRRVGELLDTWAKWMSVPAKDVMDLGYPKSACGCKGEPWGYWEDTFAEMCESVEDGKAISVNAAIDDLETYQQMAIYHKHLSAVYRFARLDLERVYDLARLELARVLPMRGIY